MHRSAERSGGPRVGGPIPPEPSRVGPQAWVGRRAGPWDVGRAPKRLELGVGSSRVGHPAHPKPRDATSEGRYGHPYFVFNVGDSSPIFLEIV